MSETAEKFEIWGLIEIMGHQKYAGKIMEQTVAGAAFLRVDVPASEGREAFTKIFGAGSIFCMTPMTEQLARGLAQNLKDVPINVWDLPKTQHQHALGYDDELE